MQALIVMAAPMADVTGFGKCSLYQYFDGECGTVSKFPKENSVILLRNCTKIITGHLRHCKLAEKLFENEHAEYDLLSSRAGIWRWRSETDCGATVCPSHRYRFGIGWRPSMNCGFPRHTSTSKCKTQHGMTPAMCEVAQLRWGFLCRVGTGICRQCMDDVAPDRDPARETQQTQNLDINDTCVAGEVATPDKVVATDEVETEYGLFRNLEMDDEERVNVEKEPKAELDKAGRTRGTDKKHISYAEDEFIGSQNTDFTLSQDSQISNWSDEVGINTLQRMNTAIASISQGSFSPLKYQLSTPINKIKQSTIRYLKRKANQSVECLMEVFAPGQGSVVKKMFFENIIEEDTPKSIQPEIVNDIIKLYECTQDNKVKCQLLALISQKLSKQEMLKAIPGLTTYRIDQARLTMRTALSTSSGLEQMPKIKHHRNRMNEEQLQHALSFFFDPSFIQIVSYGTRDLKMESGTTITIPNVVRTTCHTNMIQMYLSYCKEVDFRPLGTSSLYKILDACAASKRTNLHGLDNIAAEGVEGYNTLIELTESLQKYNLVNLEESKEIISLINSSKLYMKSDFKVHVQDENQCADHCRSWSLSDPKNQVFQSKCDHHHIIRCEKCQLLRDIEEKIKLIINSCSIKELLEDFNKELDDALTQIDNWKAHIVRTLNQDGWRQKRIESLEHGQGIVIMDWAMKYLPQRFREKQTDWFGQRGKHWHITVLIFVDTDGNICHRTYTHVLESVKQDWFAVISLLEHTLKTVKQQLPDITEVFLRSDNAGCYHCGHIWLSLPGLSNRTGIKIKEYSYSEPQAGKSYCDSKIAHMRTKMKTYVASGKNIVTAKEMKVAIDDGSGVVGCQVACAMVETSKQTLHSHKWKNVNAYTDIKYEENGVRLYRAYGIGTGLFIPFTQLQKMANCLQGETDLVVVEDFSFPSRMEGKIKFAKPTDQESDEPQPCADNESSNTITNDISLTNAQIFFCPESGCVKKYCTFRRLEAHVLFGKHVLKLERQSTYDVIKQQWASICNEVSVTLKTPVSSTVIDDVVPFISTNMGWGLKRDKKTVRFSQHVKDYLIKIFQEGEKSGIKANPQDVATQMRTLRNDAGERVFQLTECLQTSQISSYFSRLAAKDAVASVRDDKVDDEDLYAISALLDEALVRERIQ